MTYIEHIQALASNETDIQFFYFGSHMSWESPSRAWQVCVKRVVDGSKIEVDGRGATMEDAAEAAWRRWTSIMGNAERVFGGTLLEASKNSYTAEPSGDDEIPF